MKYCTNNNIYKKKRPRWYLKEKPVFVNLVHQSIIHTGAPGAENSTYLVRLQNSEFSSLGTKF